MTAVYLSITSDLHIVAVSFYMCLSMSPYLLPLLRCPSNTHSIPLSSIYLFLLSILQFPLHVHDVQHILFPTPPHICHGPLKVPNDSIHQHAYAHPVFSPGLALNLNLRKSAPKCTTPPPRRMFFTSSPKLDLPPAPTSSPSRSPRHTHLTVTSLQLTDEPL
jgi:hypothetical protein